MLVIPIDAHADTKKEHMPLKKNAIAGASCLALALTVAPVAGAKTVGHPHGSASPSLSGHVVVHPDPWARAVKALLSHVGSGS